MLISINRSVRRLQGRFSALVSVLVLGAAVLAAHGAVGAGHMSGGDMAGALMPGMPSAGGTAAGEQGDLVVAMCLAIVESAALAIGALVLGLAMRAVWRLLSRARWPRQPRLVLSAARRAPRARPPDLASLQVFRQ